MPLSGSSVHLRNGPPHHGKSYAKFHITVRYCWMLWVTLNLDKAKRLMLFLPRERALDHVTDHVLAVVEAHK